MAGRLGDNVKHTEVNLKRLRKVITGMAVAFDHVAAMTVVSETG